jgi:hypothetical protein
MPSILAVHQALSHPFCGSSRKLKTLKVSFVLSIGIKT